MIQVAVCICPINFLYSLAHSLKQYGAEFGSDLLIATGLAQTAIHKAGTAELFPYSADPPAVRNEPPTGPGRQPSNGPSLLEIIRQVCDSEVLAPPLPYNPDLLLSQRLKGATE